MPKSSMSKPHRIAKLASMRTIEPSEVVAAYKRTGLKPSRKSRASSAPDDACLMAALWRDAHNDGTPLPGTFDRRLEEWADAEFGRIYWSAADLGWMGIRDPGSPRFAVGHAAGKAAWEAVNGA